MQNEAAKIEPLELVDSEFHKIRELLEMLMSEHTPMKHSIRSRPNFGWMPATNVFETETEFVIMMDIAGMDRGDIDVYTDGKILTIRGVRNEMSPRGKKQFHKMEIQVGPFQRHIQVPLPIDSQSMFTTYSNGLLEVRLKKKFDVPEKKKIEVE